MVEMPQSKDKEEQMYKHGFVQVLLYTGYRRIVQATYNVGDDVYGLEVSERNFQCWCYIDEFAERTGLKEQSDFK